MLSQSNSIQLGLAAALFVMAPTSVSAAVTDCGAETAELTVYGVRHSYDPDTNVTATKTDTALIDTPQAISIVTRALLDDQAMQGMNDVVRYMPGVGMAQGEGNRNTPIMRGVSSTANFFVDGVRDDVEYFRDLYNVDQVEGLKGPNAMIFGRGGGGGIINRVTRRADDTSGGEINIQIGSWNDRRISLDQNQPVTDNLSGRVTAVYSASNSFRDGVTTERAGINPTLKARLGRNTILRLSYEHFAYDTVADRGIPSFAGRPVKINASTFFGSPTQSPTDFSMDLATATLDHQFSSAKLHSVTSLGNYDKFYQNVYPGAVNSDQTTVSLSAYNNATQRQNLFHQSDLTWHQSTGAVAHTLLVGFDLGRQTTDNLRTTGYFNGSDLTSATMPLSQPTGLQSVNFRPSATDANNHGIAENLAIYGQDQIELTAHLQAIVGLRYDQFQLRLRNNRTGAVVSAKDQLWSPRAGLVYKPQDNLAFYASYSRSFMPRAGDQLTSLTSANQSLDPERFLNHEVGVKWDLRADLSVTAALYHLDRTNVAIADPINPQQLILINGQTSKGLELGINGQVRPGWTLAGGYSYQEGSITQTQSPAAIAGARLAQLPRHSASLWNRLDVSPRWGLGLGLIYKSAVFTSTDNTVSLPAYARLDGGVYIKISDQVRVQINVENLLDRAYFASAHNNNNISPGAPRTVRGSLTVAY